MIFTSVKGAETKMWGLRKVTSTGKAFERNNTENYSSPGSKLKQ